MPRRLVGSTSRTLRQAAGEASLAALIHEPPHPLAVARGQKIYDVNCALCHGEDARGGDMGPNLIRGDVVMNDKDGESIGPGVQTGRLAEGMPKFEFTKAQTSDIASFLHSFRVAGYDGSRKRPDTIVVGDAKAG